MAAKTFFDLVKLALPEDVTPQELIKLAPASWWDEKPYLASAYALRKSPRFNWDAYRERYPDVKASGIDPCLHYLKHGIYEGRKLISWHKLKELEKPGAPLVSVVIINYNNAHLLEKCISSVTSQTLKNIEIIIVDDCSTDESLELIQSFAANDPRIKVIVNERNSATLITRKRGVEAATGRYLMFLDSDDYYAPDAFETAAREIAKGYDMVKFGVHVVNSLNAPGNEISACVNWCNSGESGEYFYDEILATIFRDRKMSWTLWNAIYLRELCAAGFNALGENYFTGPDDVLAVLAITHRARSLLKIPQKLIYYNFGPGVSVTSDKNKVLKYLPARCETTTYLRAYAEKYALNVGLERFYRDVCWEVISRMVEIAGDSEVASHFSVLMNHLGASNVIKVLIERKCTQASKIAALCCPMPMNAGKIGHIGIFCPAACIEDFSEAIRAISVLSRASGYRLTIFSDIPGAGSYFEGLDAGVTYINFEGLDAASAQLHMERFERMVVPGGIDVLLHFGANMPYIHWDLLLARYHGIPVIFITSQDADTAQDRSLQEAVLRQADAVLCHSISEELRLRRSGVNALYLPLPVQSPSGVVPCGHATRVAVNCPQEELKDNLEDILKAIRNIVRKAPWLSVSLICDTDKLAEIENGSLKMRKWGLEKNVSLVHRLDLTGAHLQNCSLFIQMGEGTGARNPLSAALSHGLPRIAYACSPDTFGGHPAIAFFPRGDHARMGAYVLDLLQDQERWSQLSGVALEKFSNRSPEKFVARMDAFLRSFQLWMPFRQYKPSDYEALGARA